MSERWKDWLAQAKRDLRHSVNASKSEDFEWSCFSTQQSAEKAVKAVLLYLHGEGRGHSVYALLNSLSGKVKVPSKLLDAGKTLDKHYIPARYPNGFESGSPADYYTKKDAQEAIRNAREIIKFCESCLR